MHTNATCAMLVVLGALSASCASTECVCLPPPVPLAAYDARAQVDGADELAARAVVRRDPSGRTTFVLRGYPIEPDGVASWQQRFELVVTVIGTPGSEGLSLASHDPVLSGLALEQPLRVGFGAPSLTLVIADDGTFAGELGADVRDEETAEVQRSTVVFDGRLEAIECSAEDATPVVLGDVRLDCTPGLGLGDTFARLPTE